MLGINSGKLSAHGCGVVDLTLTCVSTPERLPGTFEEELVLRACVERMRRSQSKYVKTLAAKYRKEPDTISLASSSPSGMPDPVNRSPSLDVIEIIEHTPQKGVVSQGKKDQYMKNMKRYVFGLSTCEHLLTSSVLARKSTCRKPVPFMVPPVARGKLQNITPTIRQLLIRHSVTSLSEPEKPKVIEEPIAKVATEEKPADNKWTPPNPPPPAPQGIAKEVPAQMARARVDIKPVEGDTKEPSLEKKIQTEPPALTLAGEKLGRLPSWLIDLFGKSDKFLQDGESTTIEAYMLEDLREAVSKLPFGHQRLFYGLKRTMKKNRGSFWDLYQALPTNQRLGIKRTVDAVKRVDARERTCLAFHVWTNKSDMHSPKMLLFFSLGTAKDPILIKDCVGRKMSFPYQLCTTWNVSCVRYWSMKLS